jgi:hypothetical protein
LFEQTVAQVLQESRGSMMVKWLFGAAFDFLNDKPFFGSTFQVHCSPLFTF